MTTKEVDHCIGKLICVKWQNGQSGYIRIIKRRKGSNIIETEAGQIFEASQMKRTSQPAPSNDDDCRAPSNDDGCGAIDGGSIGVGA